MESKKYSILYLDDEPQNLMTFKAAFRREYDVLTANNAKDAFDVLQENDVQVILADQRMPIMTGVEFLTQVKTRFPNPIRMILTGYSDIDAVIKSINEGEVYRFLTKPWNKEELNMIIERAIQFQELEKSNSKLYLDLQNTMGNLTMTMKRFKQYIPEEVVDEALKSNEEALMKGERREVTALFCDIRNFTSISEVVEPEEVFGVLKEFYTLMTETVKKHKGIIPQFIGDEVFAIFGAPVQDSDAALNSVYCAIDMLENGKYLNNLFQSKFDHEINIGIGINKGVAIVGNLGSQERITYTVIGDTINTAKRIETLTKVRHNTILIGENIKPLIEEFIETKAWDPVPVKGKAENVIVHEIIGIKS